VNVIVISALCNLLILQIRNILISFFYPACFLVVKSRMRWEKTSLAEAELLIAASSFRDTTTADAPVEQKLQGSPKGERRQRTSLTPVKRTSLGLIWGH
jgi:hypothetical protein